MIPVNAFIIIFCASNVVFMLLFDFHTKLVLKKYEFVITSSQSLISAPCFVSATFDDK